MRSPLIEAHAFFARFAISGVKKNNGAKMSVAAARKRKAIELAENGHADVVESKSLSKAKKTSAAAKSHTSLNRVGVKGM